VQGPGGVFLGQGALREDLGQGGGDVDAGELDAVQGAGERGPVWIGDQARIQSQAGPVPSLFGQGRYRVRFRFRPGVWARGLLGRLPV